MKPWLFWGCGFVAIFAISGCTAPESSSLTTEYLPQSSVSPTSDVSYTDGDWGLDKPLPELDQIEALLKEYSGTDVVH